MRIERDNHIENKIEHFGWEKNVVNVDLEADAKKKLGHIFSKIKFVKIKSIHAGLKE